MAPQAVTGGAGHATTDRSETTAARSSAPALTVRRVSAPPPAGAAQVSVDRRPGSLGGSALRPGVLGEDRGDVVGNGSGLGERHRGAPGVPLGVATDERTRPGNQ